MEDLFVFATCSIKVSNLMSLTVLLSLQVASADCSWDLKPD